MIRLSSSIAALAVLLLAFLGAGGCSKRTGGPGLAARSYFMGFSAIPPRADQALLIQSIQMWTKRADAALLLSEPPWDSLLAGVRADSLVLHDQLPLAQFYRALGIRNLVASVDPTNGLDRSADSAPLVAAGHSLTEPAIRGLFRQYVVAIDTLIHPDYLAVASETNLIRAIAPGALYAALVIAADSAAADVRAVDPAVRIFTTVQVETAWGRLPPGPYAGIAQDRADFPFGQVLGLSSYPYLAGFAAPESLPPNYYSRLTQGAPLPEMVIEGGWTSASLPSAGVTSSPDQQRRYIVRQAELLDQAHAIGVFQLTFTDLDLSGITLPPGSILPLFAALGLVDINLTAKPALTPWDATFRRPRQ